MASFLPTVRKVRRDGLCTVYIRVTHNRTVAWYRTDKLVSAGDVSRNGTIRDTFVNRFCYDLIDGFTDCLNRVDTRQWTAAQVCAFLRSQRHHRSLTDYAEEYIRRISQKGSVNNALLYRAAWKSLCGSLGTEEVEFEHLTGHRVKRWMESLAETKRAKVLYPICLRNILRASREEADDPESRLPAMGRDPFAGIEIPRYVKAEKRAVAAEKCRAFFAAAVPDGARWGKRALLGRDVAMLVMCLAGINTADLYALRKEDYRGGILRYKRAKTTGRRSDGAYIEMRVPAVLSDVWQRCEAAEDSPRLFKFAEMYSDAKIFNVTVNAGIKRLCEMMGMPEDERYSVYTFRHSWATIAQNECGATIEQVGFAMNHAQAREGVTRGYVKIDFTPAWELNEAVVDFVFFSNRASKLGRKEMEEENTKPHVQDALVTPDSMIYSRAYFKGEVVAEVSDIGFADADAVIARLGRMLPERIAPGCAVQFRIRNVDTGREQVFERKKGKVFS